MREDCDNEDVDDDDRDLEDDHAVRCLKLIQ